MPKPSKISKSRIKNLFPFFILCLYSFWILALFCTFGKDLGRTSKDSNIYADFVSFYRIGQMAISDDRFQIYDEQLQLKYFNALGVTQKSSQPVFAQNPPFTFLVLIPFALLPLEASFKLWIFLSLALGLIAIAYFCRSLKTISHQEKALVFLGTLCSFPGFIALEVGQTSWFLLAFVLCFFAAFLKGHSFKAGLFLFLSTCKFQYLPFLFIPVLALKKWKVLFYFALIGIASLLASIYQFGPATVFNYPHILFHADTTTTYDGVFPEIMISLRGLLSNFMERKPALIITTALCLSSLIPLYRLWQKAEPVSQDKTITITEPGTQALKAIALTTLAALLLSPHCHIYDDVLLALPALCLLGLKQLREKPAKCSLAILAFLPLLSWILIIFLSEHFKRMPFFVINFLLLGLFGKLFFKGEKKYWDYN
jgi:hypothetical protein